MSNNDAPVREKHVYSSNEEVAHAFFYQRTDKKTGEPLQWARASSVNFEGYKYRSYSSTIGILCKIKGNVAFFMDSYFYGYSMSTNRHYSDLWNACPMDYQPSIELPHEVFRELSWTYEPAKQSLSKAWDNYKLVLKGLIKTEVQVSKADRALEALEEVDRFHRFGVLIGRSDANLERKVREYIDNVYRKRTVNGEHCTSFGDYVDKKRVYNANKRKIDNVKARFSQACRDARPYRWWPDASEKNKLVAVIREGYSEALKINDMLALGVFYSTVQDRLDAITEALGLSGGYFGEVASCAYYEGFGRYGDCYNGADTLRVVWSNDARIVKTSRHVTLSSGESVRVVGTMLKAVVDYGANIVGKHIGPYTVREQDADHIKVGCHNFKMDEVRRFKKEYEMTKEEHAAKNNETAYAHITQWCADQIVAMSGARMGVEERAERLKELKELYEAELEIAKEEVAEYFKAGEERKKLLAAERRKLKAEQKKKNDKKNKKTSARKKAA